MPSTQLARVVVVHRSKLLAARGHGSMSMLADLRVEVATDTRLISTRNRAFDLLAALALSNVIAQTGLLLRLAILAVSNRDRRSFPVSRA